MAVVLWIKAQALGKIEVPGPSRQSLRAPAEVSAIAQDCAYLSGICEWKFGGMTAALARFVHVS
jgi:hypothetical protein